MKKSSKPKLQKAQHPSRTTKSASTTAANAKQSMVIRQAAKASLTPLVRAGTGRCAVELWRRCYLAPPPWTTRQIGMALWNVEAAACDKTIDWPLGREIHRRAYRADLLSCGVPEDQHDALYLWVIPENSALTCARCAAWRSARAS